MSTAPEVDRFVVVPAAYLYLLRDGAAGPEVLLQLRRGTGYMDGHWAAAAAGHVERGESAPVAVAREAAEEIGIAHPDLRFVTTMHRTAGGLPVDERVDFFFTARAWVGEPTIQEPAKCAELRWCRLDDLPDPVVPHERAVLEMLRDGTAPPYVAFGFDPDVEPHDPPTSPTQGPAPSPTPNPTRTP